MPLKSINTDQGLYVQPCGDGFTCLGFAVAEERRLAFNAWTGATQEPTVPGTPEHYEALQVAQGIAREKALVTGEKCPAHISPQLVGLEGKRVEVITDSGEKRRFYVGKSTGWSPCHLEIKTRASHGGMAADLHYKSVRVIPGKSR